MVRGRILGMRSLCFLVDLLSVSVAVPASGDDPKKGDVKSRNQARAERQGQGQRGGRCRRPVPVARGVFKQNCIRCHHGKGSEGGNADFLNRAELVAKELIKPGDVGNSYVLQRIVEGEMPPPGETPRPSVEEVGAPVAVDRGRGPRLPQG